MVLAFSFEYISKNRVLENFLRYICESFGIKFALTRSEDITTLYVEDSQERLHEFSDYIAENLPISIFLKSSSVKVVDSMEDGNILVNGCSLPLSFTARALKLAKDEKSSYFMNPFTPNEIGITCKDGNCSLEFSQKGVVNVVSDSKSYIKIYQDVAKHIKDGEIVKIKTPTGIFAFGEVRSGVIKDFKDLQIIPTDLTLVSKMVVLKEEEIVALASIEKPILEAKINMVYEAKEILPVSKVKLRLPNTLLLQFICEELYKIGVEFIFKTSALEYGNEYILNYDIDIPEVKDIEICVFDKGDILIGKGDGYASYKLKENLKKLGDPATMQFASILKERDLFDSKVSLFYMSKTHSDAVMYYDNENWIATLVNFPTFSSIQEIFDLISKSDDSGKRLIENYKKQFNETYIVAINAKIPSNLPNNIYSLFGFISLILGYSDTFDEAVKKFVEYGENFGGEKGPRVDSYLEDREGLKSDFNSLRFIRSCISFHLAGVDPMTLSFGCLESLSYFVSDMADAHKENIEVVNIALGGSLFCIGKFNELVKRNLLPNHNISFNKELPLDSI